MDAPPARGRRRRRPAAGPDGGGQHLLDAAPPALRERLLVEFVGLLKRPAWRLAADG